MGIKKTPKNYIFGENWFWSHTPNLNRLPLQPANLKPCAFRMPDAGCHFPAHPAPCPFSPVTDPKQNKFDIIG